MLSGGRATIPCGVGWLSRSPLSLCHIIFVRMQAAEAQEGGLKIARTAAVGRTRGGNLTFF